MKKMFRLRPLAGALLFTPLLAHALPLNGVLAGGNAAANTSGSTMTVTQTSSSAIMNWQSFSVAANERVNFIQPSASASILNRVLGGDPSSIFGRITATGRVFLVNPNGIVFGAGSRIDAAGLVASTANISNGNFLAGNYVFDEVTNRGATIMNRGEISVAQGGLVALVAPGVANSGVIRVDLGRVALASGNAFTLDLFGDKLVSFAIGDKVAGRLTDIDGKPLTAYVSNTGEISANGGSVLLAANVARDVVDGAINLGGIVRANSVAQRNGEIVLLGGDGVVNVSGAMEARGNDAGTAGGSIEITGREITLAGGSVLDASGDNGGGSIKVGGDYQGGGTLAHADVTRVNAGATLKADGGTTGNGGKIVLWSDQQTDFNGFISARGGSKVGAGGAAETSSKGVLNYRGDVDLAAPKGAGGFLLLDPVQLTIDATAAGSLSTTLRGGASATATTTTGDLVLASVIDGRSGTAGGSLTLTSGAGLSINADIYTNNGAVTLTAANGGIIMAASGGTATTQTLISSGSGAINMTATSGSISTQHLVTSGAVALTTNTSGAVTLNQDMGGSAGLGSLAVISAGNATLKAVKTTGALSAVTGAASTLNVDGTLEAGTTLDLGTAGGSIKLRHNVKAAGNITFNADVLVNPQDEILVEVSSGVFQKFSSAAAFASYMIANNVIPVGGNTVNWWDPVSMRATISSTGGSVTFNRGLLWDGTGTLNDSSSFTQFSYYTGQDKNTVLRTSLTPIGTRFFVVDLVGTQVNFAGTGFIGWNTGAVPTVSATDNPSGVGGGKWCDAGGNYFGLVLTSSTAMSVSGTYTNSAVSPNTQTRANSSGTNSSLFISNNTGAGSGAFTVPSSATTSAVQVTLSDIALPPVQPISSGSSGSNNSTTDSVTNSVTNAANIVRDNDVEPNALEGDTRGPSDMADFGRGGSSNGRDPFSHDFRLVGSSGDFGGQPYFTANLFDFAANKSKSDKQDDDRR